MTVKSELVALHSGPVRGCFELDMFAFTTSTAASSTTGPSSDLFLYESLRDRRTTIPFASVIYCCPDDILSQRVFFAHTRGGFWNTAEVRV